MKNRLQNSLFVLLVLFTGSIYGQEFSKGKLLYSNALSNSELVKDWILEGPAKVEFKNNWMHMYSPNEEGHHVFWCPKDFPGNFTAEWEAQNQEIDAGLCIFFFSAKGLKGESIFDVSMPKRTLGTFTDYTKGAMNNYPFQLIGKCFVVLFCIVFYPIYTYVYITYNCSVFVQFKCDDISIKIMIKVGHV